jgi:hypothetical protein
MIPAPPRAVSSSAQAWDIMRDDVTLRQSLMTHGFNEQRQRDLLALGHEDRQKGNSGYYLPARIELEIRDTNERAQALYDACCEVWEIHGLKRNRAFCRAVFDNCLQLLFGTRRAVIASELQHRDAVMRTPGRSSAAQGSLTRRMGQLTATWNQKLEKEARDSDTRERVARELAAKLLPAQMPASQPVGYRPQTSKSSNSGRKPRLSSEFVVFAGTLWRDKQGSNKRVRFRDLEWIAQQLDARKFSPPGEYLEKKSAELLKRSNSKNAHSKAGAILSWSDLVARGEQDSIRAMKRLLSRCAGKCP